MSSLSELVLNDISKQYNSELYINDWNKRKYLQNTIQICKNVILLRSSQRISNTTNMYDLRDRSGTT